jgi:hypothetical protein
MGLIATLSIMKLGMTLCCVRPFLITMLSVVVLNVVMPSVAAPDHLQKKENIGLFPHLNALSLSLCVSLSYAHYTLALTLEHTQHTRTHARTHTFTHF